MCGVYIWYPTKLVSDLIQIDKIDYYHDLSIVNYNQLSEEAAFLSAMKIQHKDDIILNEVIKTVVEYEIDIIEMFHNILCCMV